MFVEDVHSALDCKKTNNKKQLHVVFWGQIQERFIHGVYLVIWKQQTPL